MSAFAIFGELFVKSKTLYAIMRPHRAWFLPGVVLASGLDLMRALLAAYLFGGATQAIERGEFQTLLFVLMMSFVFMLAIAGVEAVSGYFLDVSLAKASASLRGDVFCALLRAPLGAASGEHSGVKLSYLINDAPTAMASLRQTFVVPLSCLFMGVGGLTYLTRLDARLALLTVGMGLFSLVYSVLFAKGMRTSGDRVQEALANSGSRLKDMLDGMTTSRMFRLGAKAQSSFEDAAKDAKQAGLTRAWLSAALGGINNFNFYFGAKIIVFVGGLLLFGGALSLADLMRASQMAGEVAGMFAFARLLAEVQGSMAGAQRVFDVMDRPCETKGGSFEGMQSPDAIVFEHVGFHYRPAQPVMKDTSFRIKTGEMVAFVGESGGGKSTILRLVQGLYTPQSGHISIMGKDITAWNADALRKSIALVPQEVPLFTGSILDNIAMGRSDATRDEIEQAARDAGAMEFIQKLPDGLDSIITERGASLSGGQRQRIAIARALLKRAPILMLDEATSALDAQSEAAVQEAIEKLKGRCTILVVAHRLSTTKMADRVLHVQTGGGV